MAHSPNYTATQGNRLPWQATGDAAVTADDTASQATADALETASRATTTIVSISIPGTATASIGLDRAALVVTPTPAQTPNTTVVTWQSATPAKATVDPVTGVIHGVAAGTSVITATSVAKPAATATCTVTVS